MQRALDGRCDSIEHGLEISDAQLQQMVRQGTWYCPTLLPYYENWAAADTPGGKRDRARAAEMLDRAGELGVVAPGAYADLISVSGDPLRDIGELGKVRFVMKNGEIFKDERARRFEAEGG